MISLYSDLLSCNNTRPNYLLAAPLILFQRSIKHSALGLCILMDSTRKNSKDRTLHGYWKSSCQVKVGFVPLFNILHAITQVGNIFPMHDWLWHKNLLFKIISFFYRYYNAKWHHIFLIYNSAMFIFKTIKIKWYSRTTSLKLPR